MSVMSTEAVGIILGCGLEMHHLHVHGLMYAIFLVWEMQKKHNANLQHESSFFIIMKNHFFELVFQEV